MAKEVDHLRELVLGLVDPSHVLERHAIARRLVPAGSRAAERAEHVLHVPGAPHQEEEERDEEDRRPEEKEQALPPGRARLERLRVDDHALALEELRERVVVGEGGNLGLEAFAGIGVPVLLLLFERALDSRALRRDLLHVAVANLLEEERAVRDARTGRLFHRTRAEVDVQRKQREEEDRPVAAQPEPRRSSRRRRGATRRRRGAGAFTLGSWWGAHASTLALSCRRLAP